MEWCAAILAVCIPASWVSVQQKPDDATVTFPTGGGGGENHKHNHSHTYRSVNSGVTQVLCNTPAGDVEGGPAVFVH